MQLSKRIVSRQGSIAAKFWPGSYFFLFSLHYWTETYVRVPPAEIALSVCLWARCASMVCWEHETYKPRTKLGYGNMSAVERS